MQAFTIPAWVWMNAVVLIAVGGYVAARLALRGRSASKVLGTGHAQVAPRLAP